jgi:UDP-N-acetylglucosamine--N-acetylmuramyl-(pentapeptide) pyrophosphoryl-undecaprenol N-acetylglucosamine transferase
MSPLLVIAAGGTGGHMYPAQALADEMLARGWRVRLTTDERGLRYSGGFRGEVEKSVVRSASFAQGSGPIFRIMALLRIARGVVESIASMRRDPPACVAGFGGYPSLPSVVAAWYLDRPRLIHEQNGVLGRVNRRFAPHVDLVACGIWPTRLPNGTRHVATGNPVRAEVLAWRAAPYSPPEEGPVSLLAFGGSQGAALFARVVPEAMALLDPDLRSRIRLTLQLRPEDMDATTTRLREIGVAADLRAFFDDLPDRLAAAHLVIARAGASSIAEITAIGRPAILMPYAAALDDHQTANATAMHDAGAAVVLRESDLTAACLAGHIAAIVSNPATAGDMAEASRAHGAPHATNDLAELVERLAQGGAIE